MLLVLSAQFLFVLDVARVCSKYIQVSIHKDNPVNSRLLLLGANSLAWLQFMNLYTSWENEMSLSNWITVRVFLLSL